MAWAVCWVITLRDACLNIYAEKAKTHPAYQASAPFYALLGRTLLKYILNGYDVNGFAKIIIIFDKTLKGKDQSAFLKVVKPALREVGKPYAIYFHRTLSDFNGQIADYAAWSRYVSLERDEYQPLDALVKIKKTDFDIFRMGRKKYC